MQLLVSLDASVTVSDTGGISAAFRLSSLPSGHFSFSELNGSQ